MRYKKRLILLFFVIAILTLIQFTLPYYPQVVFFYGKHIFHSYQTIRSIILNIIPFSAGDILYVVLAALLLVTIGKWMYYLVTIRNKVHELVSSLLHFVIIFGVFYILFVVGWGGNYYQPSLTTYWHIDKTGWNNDSTLISFDKYLIDKINAEAAQYKPLSFKEAETRSGAYYKKHIRAGGRLLGLHVKPSVFGYSLQYLGIQGYYNPFTGEAQINKHLPDFMIPFVVCHEMAHQAGIAAEDDANLLAYALGTKVDDHAFRYSSYFNLWLYVHGRLRETDTAAADMLKQGLNPLTLSHIDTLRAIRRRFRGIFHKYSGQLYDSYLKFHNQREGIESYNNAAVTVWALERKRQTIIKSVIDIP